MSFISNYYALSPKAKLSLLDYIKENTGADLKAYEIDGKAEHFRISSANGNVKLDLSFNDNGDISITKSYGKGFDVSGPSAKVNLPGVENSSDFTSNPNKTEITDSNFSVSAGKITGAEGSASHIVIDDQSGSMFEFGLKAGALNADAAASIGFDILKNGEGFNKVGESTGAKIEAKFAEMGVEGKYTSPINISYDIDKGHLNASQYEISGEFGAGAGLEGNILTQGKLLKMKAYGGLGGGVSLGMDNNFDDLMLSDTDKRELMIEAIEKKVEYNNTQLEIASRHAPHVEGNIYESQNKVLEEKLNQLYEDRNNETSIELDKLMDDFGFNSPFEISEPTNYVEIESGGIDPFEMADQFNQLEQYISVLNSKMEILKEAINNI